MGQYFVGVNETTKEFIHPSRFGDGLKFLEFSSSGSGFLAGLALLLRRSNEGGGGDWLGYSAPADAREKYPVVGSWVGCIVSIVGDYDESELYQKSLGPDWTDVSMAVIKAMCTDHHTRWVLHERIHPTMMLLAQSSEAVDKQELDEYIDIFKDKTFAEEGKGTGKEGNWDVVNAIAKAVVEDAVKPQEDTNAETNG